MNCLQLSKQNLLLILIIVLFVVIHKKQHENFRAHSCSQYNQEGICKNNNNYCFWCNGINKCMPYKYSPNCTASNCSVLDHYDCSNASNCHNHKHKCINR